jgi:uncharacterized protein YqgC (DUF456 family)
MTPDLGTRLDTVATALQYVIIPALPAHEVLALEQAALCIAQVTVAREQYQHLADYEALCLADMAALAGELITAADGGPRTTMAAATLGEVIGGLGGPTGTIPSAGALTGPAMSSTQRRRNAIAAAIDVLLRAGAADGNPEFRTSSQRLVVAHGARQSTRDRAWFRSCGMDPDTATLPSIPELIAKSR